GQPDREPDYGLTVGSSRVVTFELNFLSRIFEMRWNEGSHSGIPPQAVDGTSPHRRALVSLVSELSAPQRMGGSLLGWTDLARPLQPRARRNGLAHIDGRSMRARSERTPRTSATTIDFFPPTNKHRGFLPDQPYRQEPVP